MASVFDPRQAAPDVFPRDPAAGAQRQPATRPHVSLSQLVECEIIPRLMAHRSLPQPDHDGTAPAVDPALGERFARLALAADASEVLRAAEALLAGHMAPTTLFVEVLAPAARLLGDYWVEDRCDFVDVTMALWRLQQVVHEAMLERPGARCGAGARRALFAAMPGDQHGFGALLVAEVFSAAGWSVERQVDPETRDLVTAVAEDWFDLVGLTVSCDCHTAALPSLIASLRSVSRNPALRVMVGGRVFAEQPALADTVGADGTASDARLALALADGLVVREAFARG